MNQSDDKSTQHIDKKQLVNDCNILFGSNAKKTTKDQIFKTNSIKTISVQTPTSHHLTETFEQSGKFAFIGLSGIALIFNLSSLTVATLEIQTLQSELILKTNTRQSFL